MEADAKYGKLNFVLVSFCLIFFRSEEARTSMANDRITMFSLKGTMHDQQACITSRLLYLPHKPGDMIVRDVHREKDLLNSGFQSCIKTATYPVDAAP